MTPPRACHPRHVTPLFGLLLAALLTGCGGGAPPAPPPPPTPPAASEAPLPRYPTLTDLAAATAAAQQTDRTAKIVMTGGVSGGRVRSAITGDGALRYDDTGPAMQLTQRVEADGGPPLELGLVVLPTAAFVRPPANAGIALPAGKTWLQVEPTSADPATQRFAQLVQAIRDNADPMRSFAQFGDAVRIVSSTEDVLDGARTMRYQLRVELAKAAERQTDPAIKQSLLQSMQSGLTTLDYTLWLDAANRTIRVLVDQPLPGDQGTFTLDARYRDWGQPVRIDPPPPDQVTTR